MLKELSSFVKALLIFSTIIAITGYIIATIFLKDYFQPLFWSVLIFFIITTFAFHYGLVKSCKGDPKLFFRYYMAATGIKLFGYMIIIIGYALINRNQAAPFIITFLILYFFYMTFEVVVSYKILRKK
jgi:hypothetical protein